MAGEEPETLATDAAQDKAPNGSADKEEQPERPAAAEATTDGEEEGGGEADSGNLDECTLADADGLFERGSKAIEDGDLFDAVDSLSRALEIRVAHYGELAPECASTYYKYGCALLYKAQEESDPLGNVPNGKSTKSTDGSGCSKTNGVDDSQSAGKDEDNKVEGPSDKDGTDDNDESKDDNDDEEGEANEDESDLDLAWKMLDIARAIAEKNPEETMEKVKILSALAEVSLEREDVDASFGDYQKALSMLEHLVEPDHRRVIELNFRLCLVMELGSKIAEAMTFCEKAISLCKSRIQKLKDARGDPLLDNGGELVQDNDEIELVTGFLGELEKKLEDLEQAKLYPSSVMSEVMKMIASKSATSNTVPDGMPEQPTPLAASSQMSSETIGFDPPTASAATVSSNTVTDLGVVGRGVKRATIKPIAEQPAPKKPALDVSAEKDDGSTTEHDGSLNENGKSI